jgi:hypothetical protein
LSNNPESAEFDLMTLHLEILMLDEDFHEESNGWKHQTPLNPMTPGKFGFESFQEAGRR